MTAMCLGKITWQLRFAGTQALQKLMPGADGERLAGTPSLGGDPPPRPPPPSILCSLWCL